MDWLNSCVLRKMPRLLLLILRNLGKKVYPNESFFLFRWVFQTQKCRYYPKIVHTSLLIASCRLWFWNCVVWVFCGLCPKKPGPALWAWASIMRFWNLDFGFCPPGTCRAQEFCVFNEYAPAGASPYIISHSQAQRVLAGRE